MHVVNIKKINTKNNEVISNDNKEFLSIYNAERFINDVAFNYEYNTDIKIQSSITQIKG